MEWVFGVLNIAFIGFGVAMLVSMARRKRLMDERVQGVVGALDRQRETLRLLLRFLEKRRAARLQRESGRSIPPVHWRPYPDDVLQAVDAATKGSRLGREETITLELPKSTTFACTLHPVSTMVLASSSPPVERRQLSYVG